jgi:mycothiol synthase
VPTFVKSEFHKGDRMTQAEQNKEGSASQLQMIWPEQRLRMPPLPQVPSGYMLRSFQSGDEPDYYRLMALVGWPHWGDDMLREQSDRITPENWIMAEETSSGKLVASAMGLQNRLEQKRFDSELGWVAADPSHAGRGLGLAVCAAATAALIRSGYQKIHLFTDDHRLPALKTYLRLGYVPFLNLPDMAERWRIICTQLGWNYTPETWPTS